VILVPIPIPILLAAFWRGRVPGLFTLLVGLLVLLAHFPGIFRAVVQVFTVGFVGHHVFSVNS
jgi:UPF0716 family protein affecting phage T7 exclusion